MLRKKNKLHETGNVVEICFHVPVNMSDIRILIRGLEKQKSTHNVSKCPCRLSHFFLLVYGFSFTDVQKGDYEVCVLVQKGTAPFIFLTKKKTPPPISRRY